MNGELLALADTADEAKKPADAKTAEKPAEASPAAKKPDAEKSADKNAADKKSTDKNSADKKQDSTKPADKNAKPAAGKPAAEPPKSDIQRAEEEEKADAERKRIETDNRRKQDEYDATVKKGKAHAKELNSRFADWYYMISEDDYKKIHVGLSDLTKTKPASQANPLGPGIKSPFDLHGLKPATSVNRMHSTFENARNRKRAATSNALVAGLRFCASPILLAPSAAADRTCRCRCRGRR